MSNSYNLNFTNGIIKNNIIANDGSIQHLDMIPEHIREKYRTVWEIPMRNLPEREQLEKWSQQWEQIKQFMVLESQIERAKEIMAGFPDSILMDNESELLSTFLDLIDDADILTGWNSEGFDIPYTVNRVSRILSKDDTRRFCFY